jgi:hypothetical protein
MPRVILFIAASLDGSIARPDGGIDWLAAVERPDTDYGYAEFYRSIDVALMGRKTYERPGAADLSPPIAVLIGGRGQAGHANVHARLDPTPIPADFATPRGSQCQCGRRETSHPICPEIVNPGNSSAEVSETYPTTPVNASTGNSRFPVALPRRSNALSYAALGPQRRVPSAKAGSNNYQYIRGG